MKLIPLAVCESERFLLNVLKSLKGTFLWLRSEVELIAKKGKWNNEQKFHRYWFHVSLLCLHRRICPT